MTQIQTLEGVVTLATKPDLLSPQEIVKLARKHENPPYCARDAAIIACAGLSFLTLLDLSLLKVNDIVHENGRIYARTEIPAIYNPNGKRKLFFIPEKSYLLEILERYIDWRTENKFGTTNLGIYRSLNPESHFFLDDNGEPFGLTPRTKGSDSLSQMQPTKMRRHFQKLVLPENVTAGGLNQSFVMNFYSESITYGLPAATMKSLQALTGLGLDTLRTWTRREPRSVEQIMSELYR